jgi:hypothetical protein
MSTRAVTKKTVAQKGAKTPPTTKVVPAKKVTPTTVVPTKTTTKKAKTTASKTTTVPKKVSKKPRTPEPDHAKEVFEVLDNIIDGVGDFMDDDFSSSSDEEVPYQELIELTKTIFPEQPVVTSMIPYFNDEERILYTQPDYDIQYCISFILNILSNMPKNRVTENKILALLNNISVSTSAFWSELAWSKDIISYKFNQRYFPTFQLVESETTTEVDTDELKNGPTDETLEETLEETTIQTSQLIPLTGEMASATATWPKKNSSTPNTSDDAPTDNQETEAVIRMKYDLGRPGGLQATLDYTYVDEGVTVTDSGVRYYHVLAQEKYTSVLNNDSINRIFTICMERKSYAIIMSLFCRLCVSREFCHLVLNEQIFKIMFADGEKSPFNDYLEIIHNSMFYGFYLMYKEECTIKSMANASHRCVFDLETVQYFPVYDGALSENPYIPLTLSTTYLNSDKVPTDAYLFKPLRVANDKRGVYTVHSSQERFDIFTDGVFRDINWDKLSMTGSLMPACVIRNPLEQLFGIDLPMSTDLAEPETARTYWKNNRTKVENYFDEYYPSKNVLDPRYITDGNDMYGQFDTDKMSDIDIIVDIGDDTDFDRKVLEVFELVKTNVERNHVENPTKYPSDTVKMLRITTPNSYKYYIVGAGLHKNIELFRIFVHPLGCVSRFHFPCVRGIYAGNSIKMFPSMVSAAFTGTLLEYKWMSSAKSTLDLVCKYYTRGFTLLLNAQEHEAMRQHIIENTEQWGYLMAANNNERSISIISPIFKPRQNRTGIYIGLANLIMKPPPLYQFMIPMANFDTYWISDSKTSTHGFSLDLRFPAGHIRPPEMWKLGPYLSHIQQSAKYA